LRGVMVGCSLLTRGHWLRPCSVLLHVAYVAGNRAVGIELEEGAAKTSGYVAEAVRARLAGAGYLPRHAPRPVVLHGSVQQVRAACPSYWDARGRKRTWGLLAVAHT
jgi:hypothetical protein